jgi:hypothetical protein
LGQCSLQTVRCSLQTGRCLLQRGRCLFINELHKFYHCYWVWFKRVSRRVRMWLA